MSLERAIEKAVPEERTALVKSLSGDDAKTVLARLASYNPQAFDEAVSVLWQPGDSDTQPDPYIDAMTAGHAQEFEEEPEFCPGGCGCRLGTDDADRFECGCDEGCCE